MSVVREYAFSVGTTPQQVTIVAPSTFKILFGGLRGNNAVVSAIVDPLAGDVDQRFMLFEAEQALVTPGGAEIRKDDLVGSFAQGNVTYFLFRRTQD